MEDVSMYVNGKKTKVTLRKLKTRERNELMKKYLSGKESGDLSVQNDFLFHAMGYAIENLSENINGKSWKDMTYPERLDALGELDIDEYDRLIKEAPELFGATKEQKKT